MSGWVLCFGDELSSSTPASVSCSLTLLRITFPFFYICLHPPPIHSYLPHFFSSNCLINPTIFCLTSHQTPSYLSHSTSNVSASLLLQFLDICLSSPLIPSPYASLLIIYYLHISLTPFTDCKTFTTQTFTTPDIHHPRRSPPPV